LRISAFTTRVDTEVIFTQPPPLCLL
jgi:hypothetical protein